MKATEILAKMISNFASCKSYKDRGIIEFERNKLPAGHNTFQTFYLAPDKLLLKDFARKDDKFSDTILWFNGDKIFRYVDDNGEKTAKKLKPDKIEESNLLRFETHPYFTVPLLMSNVQPVTQKVFENNFQLKESEAKNCYRLSCSCAPLASIDIWINKEKFTLGKIRVERQVKSVESPFETFIIECMYEYADFDIELPSEIFEFEYSYFQD